jgi:2-C-methyl-D-erythritol 2,4-cyclodiphosphate synthase
MRIGHGYDAHPLKKGRKLVIGGVEIPHETGLEGHSDADVLCHAIADALLGAAALGDIGKLFPPSDAKWKDARSTLFLKQVARLLKSKGWRIENVDATIIAQQPKLAGYYEQMRSNISSALGLTPERVSVKATTTNGLGYEGRGEGIAAQAVALIEATS